MLRVIETEFLKLRRRKAILIILAVSSFMPIIGIVYFRTIGASTATALDFYKWSALSYTPWIILPVVLGIFIALCMTDEKEQRIFNQLWIVPVKPISYLIGKYVVMLCYSLLFMLLTIGASLAASIFSGCLLPESSEIMLLIRKCLSIAILESLAMLPIQAIACFDRGYVITIGFTIVYMFLGFIVLMVNFYVHPLASVTALVLHDIPGVMLSEPVNYAKAWTCIGGAGIISTVLAILGLKRIGR